MKNLRIALAQINPVVGDLEGNSKKIIKFIKKAKSNKAELIIFPELCLCGYPPEDLLHKPYFIHKNKEYLQKIRSYCDNITAIIGFADIKKNEVFNAASIINNKNIIYSYHKIYLPNYSVFDEKRYFVQGNECILIRESDIKWSVNICEDIWIRPNPFLQKLASRGVQLIINISSSPYHKGKFYEREQILKSQAKHYKATIAYCNMVGGQDELVFDGGSLIIDPKGYILAHGKQFEEDLIITDLTFPGKGKKQKSVKRNNKVKLKQINLTLKENIKKPALKKKKFTRLSSIGEIFTALTLGLKDYVYKNNFKKVVLGLSGGIDSTLTALIAIDALGKENVIAISMPSPYTSKDTLSDKKKLAKSLGIKLITVSITETFNKYLEVLKPHFKNKSWGIAEENIQARIRGNFLMAFSNKFGYLVLTTGNKSETSVGYCTLYGDMAGGFAVIKDVPKGLVYELTKYRNDKSGGKLVPKTIFTRPPSAELREDQKDEDSLPPYPILDKIIDFYVEKNKSYKEIVKSGISKDIVKKILYLIDFNEYKRRQAPPGIKITPKAFGKDRRMPITNRAPI